MGKLTIKADIDATGQTRTVEITVPDNQFPRVSKAFGIGYKPAERPEGLPPEAPWFGGPPTPYQRSVGESFDAWVRWVLEETNKRIRAFEEQEATNAIPSLQLGDPTPIE